MSSTNPVLCPANLVAQESGFSLPCTDNPVSAITESFCELDAWYSSFVSSCLQWQGKARHTIALNGTRFAMHLLLLRKYWQEDPLRCKRLHLIVFEERPLSREDFVKMGARLFPGHFQAQVNELASHWPCVLPGMHRIDLEGGNITITLAYGEKRRMLKNIHASMDTYILADSCGPAVLAQENYSDWLRYASPQVCVISRVQDEGLLRQALKTEGLVTGEASVSQDGKHLALQARSGRPMPVYRADQDRTALVIGGGLAGSGVAHALALRGWQVRVFDPSFAHGQSAGQQGHIAAALTPMISIDDNFRSRLSRAGTLRAHSRWRDFPPAAIPARCGTLELSRNKGHAKDLTEAVKAMQFPREWVRHVKPAEASELAGTPIDREGAYFSAGMLVNPEGLIQTLLANKGIECMAARVAFLLRNEQTRQWELLGADGNVLACGHTVVVACGLQTLPVMQESGLMQQTRRSGEVVPAIPKLHSLHPMGGEVMHVPAGLVNGGPRCIIGGEGYFLPAVNNLCVMGSTYMHNQLMPCTSKAGQETILSKMPVTLCANLKKAVQDNEISGWAGMRAVLQGRLPVVGQLDHAEGVWIAAAYASHGLTWSSLAGDVIGARLEGEPVPLERDLLKAISPR